MFVIIALLVSFCLGYVIGIITEEWYAKKKYGNIIMRMSLRNKALNRKLAQKS